MRKSISRTHFQKTVPPKWGNWVLLYLALNPHVISRHVIWQRGLKFAIILDRCQSRNSVICLQTWTLVSVGMDSGFCLAIDVLWMLLSKSYIRIFFKWIFILKNFILSYSYISLYMSVGGHKGQKRVSDLLQLKLQAVVNSWCGCWVPNPGLCKSRCTRNCWAASLALNPQGNCGGSWALIRNDEGTMAEQMGECCHLRSIRLESSGWSQRVCSLCFLSCASWFLLLCCGCGHCPLRATATAVLPGATVITHQEASGSAPDAHDLWRDAICVAKGKGSLVWG